ncbi:MAG: hypothetical protein ABR571_13825 [Jatrophihabitans sp.]|uniref:hypothetical protein n=1 Tax=Jatrophihabitans sp. TaxID=1932789 RepID=UPI00390EDA03
MTCLHNGATVSNDVIETHGGGASVWLPTGQHLITYSFELVENGAVVSEEHYGRKAGLRPDDPYICTATGLDFRTNQVAIGNLLAYPAG